MRSLVVTVGAIGLGLGNSAAIPQSLVPPEQTRQIAYKYGACAVQRHPRAASEAVLRNVDSYTLLAHYSSLVDSQCLERGQIVFPGDFYIYSLADALVARELTAVPIPDLSRVPSLPRRPLLPFAQLRRRLGYQAALEATFNADVFGSLNEYGECVVRKDPASARALLMTAPESAEEGSRFEELSAALLACTAEDKTMKLTKTLLRGTIALNYYRLAKWALHPPVH